VSLTTPVWVVLPPKESTGTPSIHGPRADEGEKGTLVFQENVNAAVKSDGKMTLGGDAIRGKR